MVRVISVYPMRDYKLRIELWNGRKGVFDVSPYIDKGVFGELKNDAFFRSVRPAFGGIMWPHEQDLSPDKPIPVCFVHIIRWPPQKVYGSEWLE